MTKLSMFSGSESTRAHLRALLDLAWPMTCASCSAVNTTLCAACLASVTLDRQQSQLSDGSKVFTSTAFEGAVAELITAYKDRGRRDVEWLLQRLLADAMNRAHAALANAPVGVVPVPSSKAAVRERGRLPLRELTRGLCGPGMQYLEVLQPTRRVRDQSHLTRTERAANLAGAFAVTSARRMSPSLAGCLIVDDVVTSGATAMEAVRALRAHTDAPIVIAAIARTPLTKNCPDANLRHSEAVF